MGHEHARMQDLDTQFDKESIINKTTKQKRDLLIDELIIISRTFPRKKKKAFKKTIVKKANSQVLHLLLADSILGAVLILKELEAKNKQQLDIVKQLKN